MENKLNNEEVLDEFEMVKTENNEKNNINRNGGLCK